MAARDQHAQERGWLARLVGLDQRGSGAWNAGLVWVELDLVGVASGYRSRGK